MLKVENKYLKSCFNYTGGKHKLLKQIIPLFPSDINIFVDLFCGGANVAINVEAKGRIYCIDKQEEVISFFNTLKQYSIEEIFRTIEEIIEKFGLSNTFKYGYEFYECESSTGLSNYNKEKYKALRDFYNNNKKQNKNNPYFDLIFYVLTVYGFNNQIRFNKKGNYNIPVGKRDFNENIQNNLYQFIQVVQQNDFIFQCRDFRDMDINLTEGDFLYADPPYLISTATYNEQNGWTINDEKDLLELLNSLEAKGVKFALSNVIEHKGEENTILKDWINKHKRYNVHYLDYNYNNSNYQFKHKKSKTLEVLITNY
uniref:Site-specific DNA-methyltransferase (adenine-specific) n=1 Tax=Geobacillus stearothermophilus TaxID=1422 RepID=D3YLF9_GEOSE|nr:DNA methyltransferase [Geobacillus stearothermophilus]